MFLSDIPVTAPPAKPQTISQPIAAQPKTPADVKLPEQPSVVKPAVSSPVTQPVVEKKSTHTIQKGENLTKIKAAGILVNEKVDSQAFRKTAYEAVTKTYTDAHGVDMVNRILATK
jgi:hypothetical protein